MKKKDILGNGWLSKSFMYTCEMKKINGEYVGYSAIHKFLPGTKKLYTDDYGERQQLSGDGYKWLTYFPLDESWALVTIYNPINEIIGWYFDISKRNYLDENGVPCRDDIYLDLIIAMNGQPITKDADELQEALDTGKVSIDDYHHAYKIHDQILSSKWNNVELLKSISCKLFAEYL